MTGAPNDKDLEDSTNAKNARIAFGHSPNLAIKQPDPVEKAKAKPVPWYAPGEKPLFKRVSLTTIPALPGTVAFFAGEDGAPDTIEPVVSTVVEVREDQHGRLDVYTHVVGYSGVIEDFDAVSVAGAIVRGMRCEDGRFQTTAEFKAARKLART